MVTRAWKVYGANGRSQKESFSKSYVYDFTRNGRIRIIAVQNSDKTGTNDYSIVVITRDTAHECEKELAGQLSDGIFENTAFGKVEECI